MIALLMLSCSFTDMATRHVGRQATRAGLTEYTATLGPHRVHYWEGGEGPPLMLLHGFGGDALFNWEPQIEALAAHHRLILPDLLWFGASDSAATPGLAAQADAALALIDHLRLERLDIGGISYGGFVTLAAYQRAPERFDQLIIIDSPGGTFGVDDIPALNARFGISDPAEMFLPAEPAGVQQLFDLCYHGEGPKIPKVVLADLHRNLFSGNEAEKRRLLAELPENRQQWESYAWEELPETLVIWGEYDPVFPLEYGRALAEQLSAELAIIEDTAHAPNIEKDEAFNRAVLEFLGG